MKKWVENNGRYELHFDPFYEDIILLSFIQDKEAPTCWWYVSDVLKVEHDSICENNLEEAKIVFEYMISSHYQNQISYYEDLLSKFHSGE